MEMNRRSFLGGLVAALVAPFVGRADTPADPIPDPIVDPIADPTRPRSISVAQIQAAKDRLREQALEGPYYLYVTEAQYDELVDEVGLFGFELGVAPKLDRLQPIAWPTERIADCEIHQVLEEGSLWYVQAAGELYGRGPGQYAMDQARELGRLQDELLMRQMQRVVDPPLTLPLGRPYRGFTFRET